MKNIGEKPSVRIIRMRKVPFVDTTGANNLWNLVRSSQREGITILLSGVNDSVHATLRTYGIEELVGAENVLPHIDAAVARAHEIVAE